MYSIGEFCLTGIGKIFRNRAFRSHVLKFILKWINEVCTWEKYFIICWFVKTVLWRNSYTNVSLTYISRSFMCMSIYNPNMQKSYLVACYNSIFQVLIIQCKLTDIVFDIGNNIRCGWMKYNWMLNFEHLLQKAMI